MPKKSFKDNPALAFIGSTQEPQEAHRTHGTHEPDRGNTPIKEKAAFTSSGFPTTAPQQKHYRLNLKLKAEYKDYLDRVSWENRKSITQYVNDLIQADMDTKNTQDT